MRNYLPTIKDLPEDDRPRERLIKYGAQHLSDAEILAIILRVGNRELTAVDLARSLIRECGGFRGLDGRSVSELCQTSGIGPAKAAQIKAAIELGKRLFLETAQNNGKVGCSEDVFQLMFPYLRDSNREVFKILLLTSRNTIIEEKTLFEGSLTESIVSPREVIKVAINRGAASVVFIHNHPSGNPQPSEEDKRVTRHLKKACELVGVNVLDHIIVGKSGYFSFADSGLL